MEEKGGFKMRSISNELQEKLQGTFGERVRFDVIERMFYSHDMGSLPSLVKTIIGNAQQPEVPQLEPCKVDLATYDHLLAEVGT